jgi:hypothetical protein
MTPSPVLAATAWRTNAELIADCARLGYLQSDWLTLDPTYGKGTWWNAWRPLQLWAHDLADDGVDFRALPYPDATFDAAVFDPPYVCVGGRQTSTIPGYHARYGLTDAPKTPAGLQEVINGGLDELHRVMKPKKFVLAKCQDYVWSGRLWLGTHHTLTHALAIGFEVVDRLEHLSGVRPQPPGRRQLHARRNLSTLFVLRRLP